MVSITDPNKPIQPMVDPNPKTEKTKPSDGGFDTIFKQAVAGETISNSSAEPTLAAADIRPARFSTRDGGETAVSIVDRTERLVDTLDAYREKLGENGATMKDVEPLMQQMTSQSQALATMSQSEKGADDKLQGIVDEALTLSSLEIARYNSGYYNQG
jgi:hypothetical protein